MRLAIEDHHDLEPDAAHNRGRARAENLAEVETPADQALHADLGLRHDRQRIEAVVFIKSFIDSRDEDKRVGTADAGSMHLSDIGGQ